MSLKRDSPVTLHGGRGVAAAPDDKRSADLPVARGGGGVSRLAPDQGPHRRQDFVRYKARGWVQPPQGRPLGRPLGRRRIAGGSAAGPGTQRSAPRSAAGAAPPPPPCPASSLALSAIFCRFRRTCPPRRPRGPAPRQCQPRSGPPWPPPRRSRRRLPGAAASLQYPPPPPPPPPRRLPVPSPARRTSRRRGRRRGRCRQGAPTASLEWSTARPRRCVWLAWCTAAQSVVLPQRERHARPASVLPPLHMGPHRCARRARCGPPARPLPSARAAAVSISRRIPTNRLEPPPSRLQPLQLYSDKPGLARESREMLPGTLDMPSPVEVRALPLGSGLLD